MHKTILLAAVITTAAVARANVTPNGLFSDNMVLQRGKPIPVRGTATPGEAVTVTYKGVSAKATAGADGRFRAVLPALETEAAGQDLVIAGENTVTLTNVVVGDVWLVAGQSNAEMPLGNGILGSKETHAKAKDYPNIRQLKFEHAKAVFPVKDLPCIRTPWRIATDYALHSVSAEGYFMTREINAKTGIPIGILDDNWSGSQIEPFVSVEGLALVPELKDVHEQVVKSREAIVAWCEKVAAMKADGNYDAAGAMPSAPYWTSQHNAMLEPLADFPIRGATWYQGCSNGSEGRTYVKKLEALIAGWRAKWGPELPVYIVQLASFTAKTTDPAGGDGFAKTRNAQRIVAQTVPNTGLAVAIDIGNAKDIHPKNKFDVGYRLSLWALRDVYGEKDLVVSGPLFKEMKLEGPKVRLVFDHVGSGLFAGERGPDEPGVPPTPTPDGKLRGFAVAGADKTWHWADAVIDGNDVVVSAKEVPEPAAVRYAHRGNPMGDCNLYNREGLPASPFRTDDW